VFVFPKHVSFGRVFEDGYSSNWIIGLHIERNGLIPSSLRVNHFSLLWGLKLLTPHLSMMKSLHLPSSTSMVVATSPFYSIVYFCDPLSTCHHWRLSPLLALWTTFLLPSWISQATLHESGCQSKTYYVVLLCCQEGLSFPFVSYLSRDGCAATMAAHVCLKLITIYHEKALSPSNLVFFFSFFVTTVEISTHHWNHFLYALLHSIGF
jgi:hypothetical protein